MDSRGPTPVDRVKRRCRPRAVLVSALVVAASWGTMSLGPIAAAVPASATGVATALPKSGGELKVALDSDPVCVDPSQTGLTASLEIGSEIVNTLLIQNPKTLKVGPGLASSWKSNASATSYSFVLRKGITFSNGQPLNAAAVKTYFDDVVALGAKAPDPEGYLVGYSGTTVTGPYSFTIHFSKANSAFPIAASMTSLGILAPATMAAPLSDRCAGKDLYGTGPFVLSSYSPNVSVVLKQRPGYTWGAAMGPLAAAGHTGPAYLSSIEFLIETDSSVRSGSLHSGQVDLATLIAPQDQPDLSSGGFHVLAGIDGGVPLGMAANMKGSKILQDPKVREAIQLAISRPQIEQSESPSYGLATSVLSPATLGWTNLNKYLDQNQKKAESILNADGWKVGSNGIREKNGTPLNLNTIAFYEPNVFQLVQQELREVGINMELNVLPTAQYQAASQKGDYDLQSASLSHQDPTSLWTVFGDTANGGRNEAWLGPKDPGYTQFNKIGAQLFETTNNAKRLQLTKEGQEILIQNNYDFPFTNIAQVFGVSDKVQGLSLYAARYLNLYNVSLG